MPVLGGTIFFEFKMEGQGGSCDGPDQVNEGIFLQYNVGGMARFASNQHHLVVIQCIHKRSILYSPWEWKSFISSIQYMAQYSIPIPGIWSANTQFRWFQPSPTSASWDFWGLDNVNIVPAGPGGASFTWSPGGQTTQNLTVSPTVLTNYTLTYSDGVTSCSTTVVVDVASSSCCSHYRSKPFKSLSSRNRFNRLKLTLIHVITVSIYMTMEVTDGLLFLKLQLLLITELMF